MPLVSAYSVLDSILSPLHVLCHWIVRDYYYDLHFSVGEAEA